MRLLFLLLLLLHTICNRLSFLQIYLVFFFPLGILWLFLSQLGHFILFIWCFLDYVIGIIFLSLLRSFFFVFELPEGYKIEDFPDKRPQKFIFLICLQKDIIRGQILIQ